MILSVCSVIHKFTSGDHLQTNVLTKRFNHTLCNMLFFMYPLNKHIWTHSCHVPRLRITLLLKLQQNLSPTVFAMTSNKLQLLTQYSFIHHYRTICLLRMPHVVLRNADKWPVTIPLCRKPPPSCAITSSTVMSSTGTANESGFGCPYAGQSFVKSSSVNTFVLTISTPPPPGTHLAEPVQPTKDRRRRSTESVHVSRLKRHDYRRLCTVKNCLPEVFCHQADV